MSKITAQSQKPQSFQSLYCLSLKFDRSNSTYKPEQTVSGNVELTHKNNEKFKIDIELLEMEIVGKVLVQNRQNKPEVNQITKTIPKINLLETKKVVLAKGKTLTPETLIPFRFKLEKTQHKFLETYIGVLVSVSYYVQLQLRFSENRKIQENVPFYLQVPKAGRETIGNFIYPKKKNFMVVTEDMKGDKSSIPKFKIRGELESQICIFGDDLNGSIIVDLADTPVRTIDLQMLRVERVQSQFKSHQERTEIQLIQICDGNITRNLEIPVYMILPRYYSCPSVDYMWCKVNFEVNLQIIFKTGYKVVVNIPLKIIRS